MFFGFLVALFMIWCYGRAFLCLFASANANRLCKVVQAEIDDLLAQGYKDVPTGITATTPVVLRHERI